MLDSQNFKSHWDELKHEIVNQWPRLTQTEVENTEGNLEMLNRLFVKTYGEDKKIEKDLEELYHRIEVRRKNSRPTYAGSRDNSPERKLNANYSQVNSPDEVITGNTNTPTIHEEEDLR
jgi:hypothetical protein